MRQLDETDLEILSLLAADARRPFSEIGSAVGLSGPAVSDRVERLQESGVITEFTINVDRSQLRAGLPVLVRVELPPESVERARDRVSDADGVEHVFLTADGELLFYARLESRSVRQWVANVFSDVSIDDYTVTLVEDVEWTPSIEGMEFALSCAECHNTVDSQGETARIDGDVYHFCCQSCRSRFEERFDRLEEGV